jgi:hypothetical protein
MLATSPVLIISSTHTYQERSPVDPLYLQQSCLTTIELPGGAHKRSTHIQDYQRLPIPAPLMVTTLVTLLVALHGDLCGMKSTKKHFDQTLAACFPVVSTTKTSMGKHRTLR